MYWCIYQITNKVNGKRYIGQHKYYNEENPLYDYWGSGKIIKRAIKKYGTKNFEKSVLYQRIKSLETANSMEIWAIEKYKPEYNIAKGGSGSSAPCSEETKKKLSKALKGHIVSKEVRRKISEAHKGLCCSEETKTRIAKAHKGKHHSEETRRKISEAHKGRTVSEETRKKLSDSHKGSKNPMWKGKGE